MEELSVDRGFTPDERERVGSLYWEAFGRKLRPAFVDDATGVHVVRAAMRPGSTLVARTGESVAGVCGFVDDGHGAADLTWATLRRQLTVAPAIRAYLLLGVLTRSRRTDVLVLDGICVDAAQRGRGIGSALLAAATELARLRGLRAVRLSVVDTNPRAQALYQCLGFRPVGSGSHGPLAAIYGFDRYTTMERRTPG